MPVVTLSHAHEQGHTHEPLEFRVLSSKSEEESGWGSVFERQYSLSNIFTVQLNCHPCIEQMTMHPHVVCAAGPGAASSCMVP